MSPQERLTKPPLEAKSPFELGVNPGRGVPEADDNKLGLIASEALSPQKARVLLRLALLQPRTLADIQRIFEEY